MPHPLRNIRIRNKLFIAYSCAFMLTFMVVGVLTYGQVKQIIQGQIETELSRTTKNIQNMVLSNADVSIRNYLRAVAEKNLDVARHLHRQVRRGNLTLEEARSRAREAFTSQSIGKTGSIYCLNSNGIMVVNRKRSFEGVDLSDIAFVKEQVKRKDGYYEYAWREPLEPTTRPKAVFMTYFEPWDWIISASAYRDEFSELVNIDDFRKRILELGFGEDGYPFVLSYEGDLLIHPHLEGKHFSDYGNADLAAVAQRIVREKNGHFDYMWKNPGDEDFRKKVAYFQDIPELGWVVASSSLYENFEKPLKALRYVLGIAFAVALILMIPISMWIGALITKPLEELQEDFAQGARGDFSVRMKRQSRDELGVLAGYFNTFMERLNEYSDSLRDEIAVRKEAEKKLIAMDRTKSLFLASASHELRTPLTSIIGFHKLMERNFNKYFLEHLKHVDGMGRRAEQFSQNLSIVRVESDRLGRLVNDLLDLSKIESGRMEWRDEDLGVGEVLKRAAESSTAGVVDKPDVRFEYIPFEGEAVIHADPDRVHQVLINLLSNGFKYTDKGLVTLSAEAGEDHVRFVVTDTGRGIPEDDQAKVFDIFYQVQDVNKRSSRVFGTGLGLAICKQIVSHYDGDLTVESEEGKGSRFEFVIPDRKG